MIELEHLNFGFERTKIERQSKKPLLNYSLNRLKHHFFRTLKGLEHVHHLVIELEHPIFGFQRSTIELQT